VGSTPFNPGIYQALSTIAGPLMPLNSMGLTTPAATGGLGWTGTAATTGSPTPAAYQRPVGYYFSEAFIDPSWIP